MEEITLETKLRIYLPDELPDEYRVLASAALDATKGAYAPYSHFKVGAAVLLENGEIVIGNNQENAAYPSGLCAERVALFSANALHPDTKVCAIAIAAVTKGGQVGMVTPCGACRQVLLEVENRYAYPVKVVLCGRDKIYVADSAASLLPLSFDGTIITE